MFYLSAEPIAQEVLRGEMLNASAGALVSFEGWVRDRNEGSAVIALEYEGYHELAAREGNRILEEARQRYPILGVHAVHRVGRLAIGDLAVWVGVIAEHRGAAFDGCRFVIDELKARVPIWKKEHYVDGASQWINCAVRAAESGTASS